MATSFQIFAYFVICISILSYNSRSLVNSTKEIDSNVLKTEIEKEMNTFDQYLKEIPDLVDRGKFMGLLMALAKRAVMGDHRLKIEGKMEEKILNILQITKRLACAKNLRYGLEVFKDNYLLVPKDGFQKRDKILKLLRTLCDNRRIRLTNILFGLRSDVYNSNSQKDQTLATLASLMKQLTDLTINVHVQQSVSVSAPFTNVQGEPPTAQKMNLTTALIQLCNANAKGSEEIKKVCAGQVDFWRNFDMHTEETEEQIKSLSAKLPEKEVEKLLLKETDIECEIMYALDMVRVGRILRQTVTTKYLDCSWIMYTSVEPEITKIEKELKVQWPDMSDMQRKDRFCYSFSDLHHFLSISEFHSPDPNLLPQDCRPNTEDYISYINSISAQTGQSDFAVVGLLIRQLPIPTTKKP